MIFWFIQGFFFGGGDRNAWVFLLVPIWLCICIGMSVIRTEGIKIPILKKELPKGFENYILPITIMIILLLLINNATVFANAHFNRDVREKFVDFANSNIETGDSIMIADESMTFFVGYYSEIEAVNIMDVIHDPNISDYINSSFENGTSVYVAEYWFRDDYIKKGTPRYEQTYEDRLKSHQEDIAIFNSMYVYGIAYAYKWSDIYQITELNQTR